MQKTEFLQRHTLIMAVAAGVTIANVYYAQPILGQIARSLDAPTDDIGNLPALTQLGFGAGLALLAPLGDMFDRRTMIVALEVLLSMALFGMAATGSVGCAFCWSLLIGGLAVAVQILVPMAAALAAPGQKGRTLGLVFTGTLVGILGARIISGYVATWLGWRSVFAISGVLALGVAGMVLAGLPRQRGGHDSGYGTLMASTLRQFTRFALLRRISLLGALIFGAFCSFWTVLTFHLAGAPFELGSDRIGLFGIVAVGGALAAPLLGRLSDRVPPRRVQILTVLLLIAGLAVSAVFSESVPALVVAILLIDIGVQGTQINNLAQIYALDEAAHSRINTVFMTSFFLGGALGTHVGVWAWHLGGWHAVSVQLMAWSAAALLVVTLNQRSDPQLHLQSKGRSGAEPLVRNRAEPGPDVR